MIDFTTDLISEVNLKIRSIESGDKNILRRTIAASDMLEKVFGQLKEFICRYTFNNEEEEIRFFREIKPRIFCHLLYYRKVYNIEMNRPIGTEEEQTRYLNTELEQIQHYIAKRVDFYRYIRSGATYLDSRYFLRGKHGCDSQYLDSFYFERDPVFSTLGDFRVAKIFAGDMLQSYIRDELEKIRLNRYALSETPEILLDTPRWTDTKSGLIEILYSLDALGCFDNGNISLSRLAHHFEQAFDIKLGNISRAFNDMKFRNNPSAMLDRMREALLKKIEDIENDIMDNNLKRNTIENKKRN